MMFFRSKDAAEIEHLVDQARNLLPQLTAQPLLDFDAKKEQEFEETVFGSIKDFTLTGPELILGNLFNEIGFNAVKDELFRHMVITRLIYPVSKLKTIDYLRKYKGITIERNKIYRFIKR